jgi:hypothetical protein
MLNESFGNIKMFTGLGTKLGNENVDHDEHSLIVKLNSGYTFHRSLQNVLPFRRLSKSLRIKLTILHVTLFEYETLSLWGGGKPRMERCCLAFLVGIWSES